MANDLEGWSRLPPHDWGKIDLAAKCIFVAHSDNRPWKNTGRHDVMGFEMWSGGAFSMKAHPIAGKHARAAMRAFGNTYKSLVENAVS